jgi:hypothetical protein
VPTVIESKHFSGKIKSIKNDILEVEFLRDYPNTKDEIAAYGKTVNVRYSGDEKLCVEDNGFFYYNSTDVSKNQEGIYTISAHDVWVFLECAKPVIYLYPESSTECSVKVTIDGELTCTYPDHGENGWQGFTAEPDGTLIFPDGKEYYCLYWEGIYNNVCDFSRGFCVAGEDTADFLEWALSEQGLTPREANEFIIYWLPIMEANEYNVIAFQTDTYTSSTSLEITPAPDSLLRINMAFYGTDEPIELEPQSFEPFVRRGFTVVEWGGSNLGTK